MKTLPTFEQDYGLKAVAAFEAKHIELLKYKCRHDRYDRVGYRTLLNNIENFDALTPNQQKQVERQWTQFIDYYFERNNLWREVEKIVDKPIPNKSNGTLAQADSGFTTTII